jgi:peptidoglycan biosynthesis protein MviN/MurJ (putative lipid II flippase)
MLIAAPRGLIAAAAAGGIASSLCVPIVVVALRWKLGLHIRRMLSDQVPIWGATLLMAGSVSLLGQAIPAGTNSTGLLAALLAKVAVGVVVFAGAVWLLAPEVFHELLAWAGRPVARESRAS